MRLICLVLLVFITAPVFPQKQTETELVTEKIIRRLERLEDDYLIKLRRRDFERASAIVNEIYMLLEDLTHPGSYAMQEPAFQDLKRVIKDEPFTSNRINIVETAAARNNFTVHQVIEIIDLMTFSEERVSAVRILYPWIIDKENSMLLFNAMKFSNEKEEIRKIIEGYRK